MRVVIKKGCFGRSACTPTTGVKVHLPHVILALKGQKHLTNMPLSRQGGKAHSLKPPFYKPPFSGEIQKGTGGRGRDRKCHKLS